MTHTPKIWTAERKYLGRLNRCAAAFSAKMTR